jgi:hypothetical protein
MRVPWLAAALIAGTLAARSLTAVGHVAGIAGVVVGVAVALGLLASRHHRGVYRELTRRCGVLRRRLFTTV